MDPKAEQPIVESAGIDENSLRTELIKHLSAEITTEVGFLNTLRSRMAFSVLVGPFLILGSLVVAVPKINLIWPHGRRMPWIGLCLTALCYLGLGLYGSELDRFGTDQCDSLRKTLISVAKREPLEKIRLDYPHRHTGAYLWGFFLVLATFTGISLLILPCLSSK
jgi:hypothetical protein